MNHSGEAAEQVFRITLDGMEFAIKIAGAGAKNLVALLYAILSQQKKTKGRARLVTMLKSGKPLEVFSVKNSDMEMFVKEAKQYGVLYCVVRDPKGSPDGLTDVIVREEDAPKISRIVDRFKLTSVENVASVRADIVKSKEEKAPGAPEQDTPNKGAEDKLLDELFEKPVQKEQAAPENPTAARTEKSPPSEPSSTKPDKSDKGTDRERPSVRQELKEIRAGQEKQREASAPEQSLDKDRAKSQPKPAQHQQPRNKGKKSKKQKAR